MAILLGLIIGWAVYRLVDDWQARQMAEPRVVQARGDLAADEKATIELFENASPSVAFITSVALRAQGPLGLDVARIPQGAGSGIVWDQQGHIVTNYHVVAGEANGNVEFEVTLADQSSHSGRVIGVAPDSDLAVLRINAPAHQLRPIAIGTSKDLRVGQKVLAIGNPFGLDQTLTTGIVSALGRQIPTETQRTIKDVIQTDAAINPGNSGGPLLDSAGRLIGVNTAIYSPSGASAGIGFAIPVDTVNRVVPDLIAHGRVVRPQMGISPAHDSLARRLGLTGVLVSDVDPKGPAAKAGLQGMRRSPNGRWLLGDVIVGLDGKVVKTFDDLVTLLESHKVGDTVRVTFMRGDKKMTADIQLQ
jgi:S1-C subfamily serine protease